MYNSQKFCEKCGKPLTPGTRFCGHCGQPVAFVPTAPAPAPSASGQRVWIVAGLLAVILIVACVGVIAIAMLRRNVGPTPTATKPTGAGVTAQPSSPTVAAQLPTYTPYPTYTPHALTTTLSQSPTAAEYDLYVRRMDFTPPNPTAGEEIKLTIMVATDTYPQEGPFFPVSYFRWRQSPASVWHEEVCPANDHYAQCMKTVELSYDQPGDYYFEVEADSRKEIVEGNEDDNVKGLNITVVSARSSSATPTATLAATPDQWSIEGEKGATIVHPGYKKYEHYDIFSVNVPNDWQNLAADAKGSAVTLGRQGDDGRMHTITVEMLASGQNLDRALSQWVQKMSGKIISPARSVVIGHYPAREAVIEIDEPYAARWVYFAIVGAPNFTFVVSVDAPERDLDAEIVYEAAVVSFRTPARCGTSVCPELLFPNSEYEPVPFPLPTPTKAAIKPVSGAITVFFTINSAGRPWGQVVDKQGNEYHTEGDMLTIGSIKVKPGDRIVLQTDATRFSLLFDCGLSPQSFSPCDFAADTLHGLSPFAVIQVNEGDSAYLNISGPDNWAGTRSGHEPQRYPADPVLRIGFTR